MSLRICSLFSGSTGNCTFVSGGTTNLIIDAGVSASRIDKALLALKVPPESTSVLITHRHFDHIKGLSGFVKNHPGVDVYAHESIAREILGCGVIGDKLHLFSDEDFYVGDVTVSPFALSHDVFCVGFSFICGGKKITCMTDTGVIPPRAFNTASDSDLILIECNHSPELLSKNTSYSFALKQRISSSRGHLSNEACAEAIVRFARAGVKHFILAHLSRENNYPELAYYVCREALKAAGINDVSIEVALADRLTSLTEIK